MEVRAKKATCLSFCFVLFCFSERQGRKNGRKKWDGERWRGRELTEKILGDWYKKLLRNGTFYVNTHSKQNSTTKQTTVEQTTTNKRDNFRYFSSNSNNFDKYMLIKPPNTSLRIGKKKQFLSIIATPKPGYIVELKRIPFNIRIYQYMKPRYIVGQKQISFSIRIYPYQYQSIVY